MLDALRQPRRPAAGCSLGPAGLRRGSTTTGRQPRSGRLGPTLVAALGDSITAGTPRWDPNPGHPRSDRLASSTAAASTSYWAERAPPGTELSQLRRRRGSAPTRSRAGSRPAPRGRRADHPGRGQRHRAAALTGRGARPEPAWRWCARGKRLGLRRGDRRAAALERRLSGRRPADPRRSTGASPRIGRTRRTIQLIRWYRVLEDPARPRPHAPASGRTTASPLGRRLPAAGRGGRAAVGELAGAGEHRVHHRLGQLAGEGVLLARVEAAEQDRARPRRGELGAVAEARLGAAARAGGRRRPRRTRPGTRSPPARAARAPRAA